MAKRAAEGMSQSAFIREKLRENPASKAAAVASAWQDAGHPGEIKNSLFYLVKNKMGLSKPREGATSSPKQAAPATRSANAIPRSEEAPNEQGEYLQMEESLDSLIRRADQLRQKQLADELRVARRRVSARLI